ncbi:MAG: cysteine desulfurase family protein [Planctomycetota bacterium]|jgi:cysteine desulfurase
MTDEVVYLDNNATTRPLPEVVEAMLPFMCDQYANPSSVHQFGQTVRHKVECAREQVADLIGAKPKEIIFTSNGTESINLAILGLLHAKSTSTRKRFVTTAVEHPAVLRVAQRLEEDGYAVDCVGVDREGRIDEAEWEAKLTDEVALASIIHANNETGVIFDVATLAAVAAERGIPVHVDAVQSVGKLPIDVSTWPVQLVSMAAHKFHGPKGVGALYQRRRTRITPLIVGGSQERNLRGGTEDVAGIIGMGVAAKAAKRDCEHITQRVGALRDALESGLSAAMPDTHVNAQKAGRIYNTTNISFEGLQAEAILILLSEAGVCASSGAACSSGSLEPSHVLKAMDLGERIGHGAIRFSLSRFNTLEEIDRVVATVPGLLSRLIRSA